jgi:hypothetical protein
MEPTAATPTTPAASELRYVDRGVAHCDHFMSKYVANA